MTTSPVTIDELRSFVRDVDAKKPRSLQVTIGPSDAGTECVRKLGHKLAQTKKLNTFTDPWPAIVGFAVHAWLDNAFIGDRWRTDVRVTLPGYMTGTADLVDLHTSTVIDHKVVGATAMKRYREQGPSKQYRTQVHLYAAGLEIAGTPVEHVALAFWSRSGNLRDSWLWTEPYDRAIADQALARIDAIRTVLDLGGVAALPTSHDHCDWCPYYLPAATNLSEACPGHAPNPTQ
jgi:hypothetical protein